MFSILSSRSDNGIVLLFFGSISKVEPLRSPQVVLSCGSSLLWAHLTSPEPNANFTAWDYIASLRLSVSVQEISYVYVSTLRKHATMYHPGGSACSRRYTADSGRLPHTLGGSSSAVLAYRGHIWQPTYCLSLFGIDRAAQS